MAKKKSSKKSSNLGKFLYLIAAVLGVVAVVMMFADVVKYQGLLKEATYTGSQVVFGYTNDLDVKTLGFSFMAMLPYLLVLAGVVLADVSIFAKKNNKVLDYVSVIAFVVAGVLFFCVPNFMVFADTIAGKVAAEIDYKLAVGSIVSANTSILAGSVVLVKTLLKK